VLPVGRTIPASGARRTILRGDAADDGAYGEALPPLAGSPDDDDDGTYGEALPPPAGHPDAGACGDGEYGEALPPPGHVSTGQIVYEATRPAGASVYSAVRGIGADAAATYSVVDRQRSGTGGRAGAAAGLAV
jgi:hypothetical protein